ncbi:MAG: endonuclease III [Bacteroidetes bacterium]|nr:endonuclease III [Bacteroidota bacterium]MBR3091102.1 endonuclease III [Bacteroidota bacterium]
MSNTKETKRKRDKSKIKKIIDILSIEYSDAKTDLQHTSPFELLIATMLSAQCTDKRVNMILPNLFGAYPTPKALSEAEQSKVEKIIYSTGFYKNKAKNIINCASDIVEKYSGSVPDNIEELTKLPGVGRKTANCVISNYYTPAGIVVDTHVSRIAKLLGLVDTRDAVVVERYLMEIIDYKYWNVISNYFIRLGRDVCVARHPKCEQCKLQKYCDYYMNDVHKNKN